MSDSSCRLCGGTGSIDDFGFYDVPCPDCNGTGEQPVAYEWTHEERPCHCTPEHRPAVQRTLAEANAEIERLTAQVKERDAEIATLNERLSRGGRMTRKRARGNARKIIVLVGDIQDLIGEAQGAYLNDRASDRAAKVLNALETAFGKCLEITGMYEPVEVTRD